MWTYILCGVVCYFIGMIHSAYYYDRFAAKIFREALEIIRKEREEMRKKIEWEKERAIFNIFLKRNTPS